MSLYGLFGNFVDKKDVLWIHKYHFEVKTKGGGETGFVIFIFD